ncbi:Gfo/Idh/MocA family protein [Peribacillus sp. B-H-3]|uniref:Gfo/Idh/MocA family protein n=1 Tax=Peribacillus sp. B-H-3 TaxID=3400420 RepID=UPI003B02DC81
MVNLLLAGTWHVHTRGFVKEALQTGKAKLKAVWDNDEVRGRAVAEEFGVPFERDLAEVLKRQDIGAVMVECATTMHKEVILMAARAKKHIFTDKALALTVEDCLEIQTAIEENGVKFMISLESQTIGAYQYAKKLVDGGMLGKVTSVYFRRAHQAAIDKNMLPPYWFDSSETGGGVTLDLGCHGLYLLPYFCGEPVKVTCLMNELYGTGSDEISTTVIEFAGGAIGTAHTSFASYRLDNMLEIIGTEGILVISGHNESGMRVLLQSKSLPGHEDLSPVDTASLLKDAQLPSAQFIDFVINEKKAPDYDMDKAIMLTRLIECAYESAEKQKTVLY